MALTTPRILLAGALAALTASALTIPALAQSAPATQTVTVTLTDVRADAGPLYVGLQTEAQFLKFEGAAGTKVDAPTDGTVTVTLTDVPAGRYSVSAWQDTDRDGRFSMGAGGTPTDGWSMIGAAALRGPPRFDSSSFAVADTPATVALTMVYPK